MKSLLKTIRGVCVFPLVLLSLHFASSPVLAADECIETAIGCIPTEPNEFASWLMGKALVAAALFAVLLFIVGGYTIVSASGSPERLTEGKQIITAAITGLLFILISGLILHIIGFDVFGLEDWLY